MRLLDMITGRVVAAMMLGSLACSGGSRGTNDTAAAPVDTAAESRTGADTAAADTVRVDSRTTNPSTADTVAADTSTSGSTAADTTRTMRVPDAATPPIVPQPEGRRDTPPGEAAAPAQQGTGGGGPKVSKIEYEGWRQYSVNCARCHGQDVLPNPVAANLLISLGPGGPMASGQKFFQVVSEGRPERGMPAFKAILSPEQIRATFAYVKGRADKRIPPGRPDSPS